MEKEIVFEVSGRLDLLDVLNVVESIYDLEDSEKYVFDFDRIGYVNPFSMLYFTHHLNLFADSKPDSDFSSYGHQGHSYLAHMGFFQEFGLDYGKKPGEAKGSSRYLPIIKKEVNELWKESTGVIGDRVEEWANELSKLLIQADSGDLLETLTYSIREIMRNVVEHSKSDYLMFCGQYWPSKNKAEIAILDSGIGISKGLSTNPNLEYATDKDAINLSLMPGISGKAFKGSKLVDKNDPWANSGYGLYMTNRICSNGGSFFVVSGDSAVYISKGYKNNLSARLSGTAISMEFDVRKLNDLNAMLKSFREEGRKIEKDLKLSGGIEPSSASMMLSKDFKPQK